MKKIQQSKTLEIIYLSLITLTIFALVLGKIKLFSSFMFILLLLSTVLKAQLIIDYFMGLKQVQAKYRYIPTVWLSVIILGVAGAYYF